MMSTRSQPSVDALFRRSGSVAPSSTCAAVTSSVRYSYSRPASPTVGTRVLVAAAGGASGSGSSSGSGCSSTGSPILRNVKRDASPRTIGGHLRRLAMAADVEYGEAAEPAGRPTAQGHVDLHHWSVR